MNTRQLKPQSLTNIVTLTKYRLSGENIEDIITNDLGYVTWCLENGHLLLDDVAYEYYMECLNG